MGAWALEKPHGGRGILLGGVPGVPPAKVLVIGGGIVGYNAALIAVGMQADVWVLDKSVERMRDLEMMLDGRITLAMSNELQIQESVQDADLVIGAVLIPGARAPKLITREMLPTMKPGSVLVDVAIDQGGCAETSKPTTLRSDVRRRRGRPLLRREHARRRADLVHEGADERHAAVRRGDREARLAAAVARDPSLGRGVNVLGGKVTYEAVAEAHGGLGTPLGDELAARACLVLALRCGVLRPRRELHDDPGDAGRDRDDRGDVEGDAEEPRAVLIAF